MYVIYLRLFLRTSMINDHDPQRFKFQSAFIMHLITLNCGLRTLSCVCNVIGYVGCVGLQMMVIKPQRSCKRGL